MSSTPTYFGSKFSQQINQLSFATENDRTVLTEREETRLLSSLEKMSRPVVFDRHFYLPDWSRLGERDVNMINMVREPVSRMTSLFYYLRSPARWASRKDRPPRAWFNKELNTCVLEGDRECQVGGGGQDLQASYFCGSHIQCANSTNPALLQTAKFNLENRSHISILSKLIELKEIDFIKVTC